MLLFICRITQFVKEVMIGILEMEWKLTEFKKLKQDLQELIIFGRSMSSLIYFMLIYKLIPYSFWSLRQLTPFLIAFLVFFTIINKIWVHTNICISTYERIYIYLLDALQVPTTHAFRYVFENL